MINIKEKLNAQDEKIILEGIQEIKDLALKGKESEAIKLLLCVREDVSFDVTEEMFQLFTGLINIRLEHLKSIPELQENYLKKCDRIRGLFSEEDVKKLLDYVVPLPNPFEEPNSILHFLLNIINLYPACVVQLILKRANHYLSNDDKNYTVFSEPIFPSMKEWMQTLQSFPNSKDLFNAWRKAKNNESKKFQDMMQFLSKLLLGADESTSSENKYIDDNNFFPWDVEEITNWIKYLESKEWFKNIKKQDDKIKNKRAVEYVKSLNERNVKTLPLNDFQQILSTLVEIVIAAAIHRCGFEVNAAGKPENSDTGNTDVDFEVKNDEGLFLLEVVKPNESERIKNNTTSYLRFYSPDNTIKKAEDNHEIIKAQNNILDKVATIDKETQQIEPIKFPPIQKGVYNIIVICTESLNLGTFDETDHLDILFNGICRRRAMKEDDQKKYEWVKYPGLFDENNSNPRSQHLRERIHAICFMKYNSWKSFEELGNHKGKWEIYNYYNPKFFKKGESLSTLEKIAES